MHKVRGKNYADPFQSPRANPKHAFHQVNGETEQSQHNIILEVQTRKRS
ncbi:YpzG family protein [Alkalihalobacillus sp. BA299]|nr:YpzG family protein [Alkalihalobacillus sp. BA299]